MIKMYQAEVLGKLPVIQHFLFGSILPYQGIPAPAPKTEEEDAHWGHSHAHVPAGASPVDKAALEWGDCCGIPVPSAFAAAADEAEKKRSGIGLLSGQGIRPVPFD